jgi:hypothetical protein
MLSTNTNVVTAVSQQRQRYESEDARPKTKMRLLTKAASKGIATAH